MDYKYIEQLLERYWEASSSPEEEAILRAFFAQSDVPAHLEPFRDLFAYEAAQTAEPTLGADFDARLLAKVEQAGAKKQPTVRAHRAGFGYFLRPIYNAAAAIVLVFVLGTAANHVFNRPEEQTWDYAAESYSDSYDNPQEALETLDDGLRSLQEVLSASHAENAAADARIDSLKQQAAGAKTTAKP